MSQSDWPISYCYLEHRLCCLCQTCHPKCNMDSLGYTSWVQHILTTAMMNIMWVIWYKVGISDCLGAPPPPNPFPHSPNPYIQIGTNVGNLIQGGISDCLANPPPNFPTLPTLTNKNGTNEGNLKQGRTISFSTHHFPGFPPPPPSLYKPWYTCTCKVYV